MNPQLLPARWEPLRPHPIQKEWWNSKARFTVVPAGRRSGKTEISKRKIVRAALRGTRFADARFFAAAPTRDQAQRIYWNDIKALVPPAFVADRSESHLRLGLINGSEISVIGMDKPERIEGSPWDGGVLDEVANMKSGAWPENVRPALSDRNGWCALIGVPEGRNHYYDLWKYAISGQDPEWAGYTWPSADILPPSEVAAAQRQLDELTFQQEYFGSFISFEGRAYYSFQEATHCAPLAYNPDAPLAFCFDFNVEPGVAAIIQEQHLPNGMPEGYTGTGVIGEVHIPRNSNTPAVCRKLIQDWGDHRGDVSCYGDATGGSRGTAKTQGSDWELIRDDLRPVFGDRLYMKVGRSNPPERARVNAVNSRFHTSAGEEWMMVDPAKAPNVVRDFEGVRLLSGGSGEIDKRADPKLSHLSDAIGYYVHAEFPVVKRVGEQADMY